MFIFGLSIARVGKHCTKKGAVPHIDKGNLQMINIEIFTSHITIFLRTEMPVYRQNMRTQGNGVMAPTMKLKKLVADVTVIDTAASA